MSEGVTVLITGANRGIGKALVAAYLSRSSNVVIAGVRDPSATSESLNQLPRGSGSLLLVVKLDVTLDASVDTAVGDLDLDHGINSLDIVISNAGVHTDYTPMAKASIDALQEHIDVNAYGALKLFQHTLPLLRRSATTPKFIAVSSLVGSLGHLEKTAVMPIGVYGASKALLNYLVKRLAIEVKEVVSLSIAPGYVDTDMIAPSKSVMESKVGKAISPEQSAEGMLRVVTDATHEKTSGRFIRYDGQEMAW